MSYRAQRKKCKNVRLYTKKTILSSLPQTVTELHTRRFNVTKVEREKPPLVGTRWCLRWAWWGSGRWWYRGQRAPARHCGPARTTSTTGPLSDWTGCRLKLRSGWTILAVDGM